jgi:hypothetical protein
LRLGKTKKRFSCTQNASCGISLLLAIKFLISFLVGLISCTGYFGHRVGMPKDKE